MTPTIPTIAGSPASAASRLLIIKEKGGSRREFRALLTGEVSESLQYGWSAFMDGGNEVFTKFLYTVKGTAGKLAERFADFRKIVEKIPGAVAKNPSLTRMLGGFPDHLDLTVNCRLWTYSDPKADIYEPLVLLKEMATPDIRGLGQFNPKYVSVRVGNFLRLSEAVIMNIATTHSQTIVEGVPAWVDVAVQIRSSKIVTQRDIRRMHVQVRAGTR